MEKVEKVEEGKEWEAVAEQWHARHQSGETERALAAPTTTRILIVDNEPRIVDILVNLLTDDPREFRLETAMDGEDALLKVEAFDPSLLILDVVMRGLHGIEVCRRLKRNPERRTIKILGLTGYPRFAPALRKAGADACLTKPFDMWQVQQAVDRLIAYAGR